MRVFRGYPAVFAVFKRNQGHGVPDLAEAMSPRKWPVSFPMPFNKETRQQYAGNAKDKTKIHIWLAGLFGRLGTKRKCNRLERKEKAGAGLFKAARLSVRESTTSPSHSEDIEDVVGCVSFLDPSI